MLLEPGADRLIVEGVLGGIYGDYRTATAERESSRLNFRYIALRYR
jgi:hypothetical protein